MKCAGAQQNIGSPTYCLVVITKENKSKTDVVCLLVNLSMKSSSFLNLISLILNIRRINLSTIVVVVCDEDEEIGFKINLRKNKMQVASVFMIN